jgi:hypothetical protein
VELKRNVHWRSRRQGEKKMLRQTGRTTLKKMSMTMMKRNVMLRMMGMTMTMMMMTMMMMTKTIQKGQWRAQAKAGARNLGNRQELDES